MADFINGIFITEKENEYGSYLSIGFTKEGLKAIASLTPSDSGFYNVMATRQKNNPEKFSVKPMGGKTAKKKTDDAPW